MEETKLPVGQDAPDPADSIAGDGKPPNESQTVPLRHGWSTRESFQKNVKNLPPN